MNNGQKALASIGTAMIPITYAFYKSAFWMQDKIQTALNVDSTPTVETTAADLYTIAGIAGLTLAAWLVSLPVTKGVARIYGAQLDPYSMSGRQMENYMRAQL